MILRKKAGAKNKPCEAVVADGEVFEIPAPSNKGCPVSSGIYGRFRMQLSFRYLKT